MTNKEQENPGAVLVTCERSLSSTKAQYRFHCDSNMNGVADEHERSTTKNYNLNSDGTCTRNNVKLMSTGPNRKLPPGEKSK